MKRKPIIIVMVLACYSLQSASTEIAIENHSFEDPVATDGQQVAVNSIPGWMGEGTFWQIYNPDTSHFSGTSDSTPGASPIDGLNSSAINVGAKIYQELNANVEPGVTYTLSLLAGHRIASPFGDSSVSLWAGNEMLAEAFPSPPENTFVEVMLTYTAPAAGSVIGKPIRIELQAIGTISQPWFDDIHLTASDGPDTPCAPHRATAIADVVNGFVVGLTVTDSGCGYTNAPQVEIVGGGGSSAVAEAMIENGRVTAINVLNAGCCYTNRPLVLFESPPFEPSLSIQVSQVTVTMNVRVGIPYVLESTTNFMTWDQEGAAFIPDSEFVAREFDVVHPKRYYRVRQIP